MTQASGKKTGYIELEKGGTIKIEFYPDSAPNHVARFEELANSGFYNNLTFHRVEPGFVVQGGDPSGNGTGGTGRKLKAEFNSRPHVRGTVAMARANDPNSGDCQFYICLDEASFLNNKYTVFGQVVQGMENVDKIRRGDRMKSVRVTNE